MIERSQRSLSYFEEHENVDIEIEVKGMFPNVNL